MRKNMGHSVGSVLLFWRQPVASRWPRSKEAPLIIRLQGMHGVAVRQLANSGSQTGSSLLWHAGTGLLIFRPLFRAESRNCETFKTSPPPFWSYSSSESSSAPRAQCDGCRRPIGNTVRSRRQSSAQHARCGGERAIPRAIRCKHNVWLAPRHFGLR